MDFLALSERRRWLRIGAGRPGKSRGELFVRLQEGIAVALLIGCGASASYAKDLALIVNKGSGMNEITMAELVKVCKAQTNRWPDGKPATFIMRNPTSSDAKIVVEKIYASTPDAVNGLITTANHERTNHPAIIVVTSDDELVKRVASTPGAVGLVDVYAINSSVEVVKIGGKLPLEPGYALHGN
jgi:ABC-type phosphate transport system substrate-binding protein